MENFKSIPLDQDINTLDSSKPIYSSSAMFWHAILFSPLILMYMFYSNLKRINKPKEANISILYVLFFFMLLAFLGMMPAVISRFALFLHIWGSNKLIEEVWSEKHIEYEIARPKRSLWRSVFIGFALLGFYFFCLLLFSNF